jgi:hypothetical protein
MASVAEALKQFLEGKGHDSIAVGAFTGPARLASSGGSGLKRALAEELKKVGIRVDRNAKFEIKLDYSGAEDRKTTLTVLALNFRVLDQRTSHQETGVSRSIFDLATIAAILGTTAQIPPVADEKTRDDALRKGMEEPPFALAGSRVSTPGSPYAVEVLVKSRGEFRPRPAELVDGLAFVPIKRDEIYAIRLINDSPHDAAVTISIDGLSAFTFSEVKDPKSGRPRYTHFIVPKRETKDGKQVGGDGIVMGWHIKDSGADSTDSFQVMEYAKSAHAEMGTSPGDADIGTITATFAAAWPKGTPPPADEPDAASRNHARSGDATGRGPKVGVEYKPVDRELGVVRAAISVRYTK